MKKILTALTALTIAAGLSACTLSQPEPAEAPAPPPAAVETGEAPVGDSVEAPAPEQPTTGTFGGDGFRYDDGLELGISEGKEFTPTEWASADEADLYLRFTVTIKNGTDAAYDPSMFFTTMSSGGVEMAEVFDTDSKLDGSPMTPVLPGKTVAFDIGYPVVDPKDIVMNVTTDYDHADVLFTN